MGHQHLVFFRRFGAQRPGCRDADNRRPSQSRRRHADQNRQRHRMARMGDQRIENDNVTMLGYPCNLDSCLKMEETGAQAFESGGNNTTIYGSAMRGGASGGPWIQDYGIQ